MTHFGVASVNRALVSLKEKNYISWISGRNSKKGGAVSNKYTLYLSGTPSQSDIPLSQSDIPPLSEREGQSITVIYPLSHSDRQKRIEKETNTNLTKEMAGLVGKSFLEAARPQAPKEPSGCSDAAATDVFDDFWSAYPNCIYKQLVAFGRARRAARNNALSYTARTLVLHDENACPTRMFSLSYTEKCIFPLHGAEGVTQERKTNPRRCSRTILALPSPSTKSALTIGLKAR